VLITDEAISAEEQQRVKVAFAEGYLAGSGQKAPGRTMKWLKIIQQLLTIVIFLAIFVSFMGKAEQWSEAGMRAPSQHRTIKLPGYCISLFLCKILFSMDSDCADVKTVQSPES
jgi:hypothetical protein